jgi:hypothetical protein
MRTKTLLIAAVALAVGVISSQAQVYSQNVVGYVNVVVTNNGYTQISTPLDYDGSGTNNRITYLIGTNLPKNSIVEVWNGTGFTLDSFTGKGAAVGAWGNTNLMLNPGLGYFVYNPSNNPVTLTFVGNVLQGNLTNGIIRSTGQYSSLGYMAPISGGISSVLGYKASPNDQIMIFNMTNSAGTGGYNIFTFNGKTSKWSPSEPVIQVGQGFFVNTTNTGATLNTNFVVQ